MRRQVFIVWFVILITWSFYRAYFHLPEAIDEFLIKPLVFVFPVLAMVFFKENRPLSSLGLVPNMKSFMTDIYIGVVLGIVFAFEGLFANYVKYGTYAFSPLTAVAGGGGLLPFLALNLGTSLWEEILGRGYMYKRLFDDSKSQFKSALISSLLFFLLHVPIMFTALHLTGISLIIYPVSIILLALANCYVFSLRGSLILPILIHTFWNMTVALYL